MDRALYICGSENTLGFVFRQRDRGLDRSGGDGNCDEIFLRDRSAESKQPRPHFQSRLLEWFRDHSFTIFLGITGVVWILVYIKMDSEAKWGEVVGNIVSEWTQLLGLVLMTKKLIEAKSKESR